MVLHIITCTRYHRRIHYYDLLALARLLLVKVISRTTHYQHMLPPKTTVLWFVGLSYTAAGQGEWSSTSLSAHATTEEYITVICWPVLDCCRSRQTAAGQDELSSTSLPAYFTSEDYSTFVCRPWPRLLPVTVNGPLPYYQHMVLPKNILLWFVGLGQAAVGQGDLSSTSLPAYPTSEDYSTVVCRP
ncbi:hypothetical protein J6590_096759 [Homalodisca vitripennis]|nr:hypothetical protein J6590_096759 [Homalodisca vitripennis]